MASDVFTLGVLAVVPGSQLCVQGRVPKGESDVPPQLCVAQSHRSTRFEMPKTLLSVNPKKLPWEQDPPVHNRWHPDIPPTATVAEGDVFRVETIGDERRGAPRCVS